MFGIQRTALIAALALGAFGVGVTRAQTGTAITYQGKLTIGGSPVNSVSDFRFTLWDDPTSGSQIAGPVLLPGVHATNGVFTTEVDFGTNPYTSDWSRWLQTEVANPAGSGTFTLVGRHRLTAVPYSLSTRGIVVDNNATVGVGPGVSTDGFKPLTIKRNPFSGGYLALQDADSGVNPWIFIGDNGDERLTLVNEFSNPTISFSQSGTVHIPGSARVGTGEPLGVFVARGWNYLGSFSVVDFPPGTKQNEGTQVVAALAGNNLGPQIRFSQTELGWPAVDIGQNAAGGFVVEYADSPALVVGTSRNVNVPQRLGVGTETPSVKLEVQFDAAQENGVKVVDTVGGVTAIGVESRVNQGYGVWGEVTAPTGTQYGVYGRSVSATGFGVYANGRIGASGTKSFMIDHPLDPEGAVLFHYSSESPEPQNRYNGTVILDGNGTAVVHLPDYFETINTDFRYQLTAIGAPGPLLHIAREIQRNHFVIAGGQPGMKVSWEVVARRSDRFVEFMGAPTEVLKSPEQRGTYIAPELYGQPEAKAMFQPPVSAPSAGVKR